jgi:integrase
MGRPRTGSSVWENGRLYARITYIDPITGKQRSKCRRVQSNKLTDLPKVIRELENEREQCGPEIFDGERMTFRQLAEQFSKEHLKPATIINGRKVDGLKSLRGPKLHLAVMVEHFGDTRIRSVTHKAIENFKMLRLKTPTVRGGQRSITSVNRELQVLRQALRFAHDRGCLLRNPFNLGKPLINVADETQRERILTPEEERRLLATCVPPRTHLRPVVIVGIDTFMRQGELFGLVKSDIDFDNRILRIRSTTTKTEKPREIGLTGRAYDELLRLTEYLPDDAKVFTLGSVKRSWETARRLAGLENLRLHDLRHTGITRRLKAVVKAGIPWHVVMKESGHTQIKTFMRYFNPDDEILRASALAMDFEGVEQARNAEDDLERQFQRVADLPDYVM